MEKRINIFFINKPIIYILLPVIYTLFLQIVVAETKGYWELPYEHSPELSKQIEQYKKTTSSQEVIETYYEIWSTRKQFLDFEEKAKILQLTFENTRLTFKEHSKIIDNDFLYMKTLAEKVAFYFENKNTPSTITEVKHFTYQILKQDPILLSRIPSTLDALSDKENIFYYFVDYCEYQANNKNQFQTVANIYRWLDVGLLLHCFAKIHALPENTVHPYLFNENKYLMLENMFITLKTKPAMIEFIGTENDVFSYQHTLDILYEYETL